MTLKAQQHVSTLQGYLDHFTTIAQYLHASIHNLNILSTACKTTKTNNFIFNSFTTSLEPFQINSLHYDTEGILPPTTMNWDTSDTVQAFPDFCGLAEFWFKITRTQTLISLLKLYNSGPQSYWNMEVFWVGWQWWLQWSCQSIWQVQASFQTPNT